MEAVTVSVAVSVWLPVVFKVAENVPAPLVKVAFAGSTACPSLLVKCAVPLYVVAGLPTASSAVTVKVKGVPAVAEAGAETVKCAAEPAVTVIAGEMPVMEAVTVSVAVSVWLPVVFRVAGAAAPVGQGRIRRQSGLVIGAGEVYGAAYDVGRMPKRRGP